MANDYTALIEQTLGSQQSQQPAPRDYTSLIEQTLGQSQPPQPMQVPSSIAQNIALAGQGYLGNFLDEASAAVKSVPSYLGSLASPNPEQFGEIYNQELDKSRQVLSQAKQDNPVMGTVSEIGGAIASPVGKLKLLKGAGVLANAGNAALQGSVYGAGAEGTISDRLAAALQQGAIGGGVSATLGATGKGLGVLSNALGKKATNIQRSAYGLTPSDFRVGVKGDIAKKAVSENKVWPAEKAFSRFKNTFDSYDPAINAQTAALAEKDAGKKIGDLISKLDANSQKRINIDWDEARKVIETNPKLDSTDVKSALKELTRKKKLYDGTKQGFSDAQLLKERVASNAKIGQQTSNAKAIVNKELAHRLRKAIEDSADGYDIKGMNSEVADMKLLRLAFEKAKNRAETEAAKPTKMSWATTGGYGVPLLLAGGAGVATQDPSVAIAAGLGVSGASALLNNPNFRNKLLAPTLSGISKLGVSAGDRVSSSSNGLARALAQILSD